MSVSLNRVQLIGNVGREPEIRTLQNGGRVANLSIATTESWNDKVSGEKKERTEWHRIVVWGPVVDVVEKYLHKGSMVFIEGTLQTRKWKDQAGVEKYATEIVVQGPLSKVIAMDAKPTEETPSLTPARGGATATRRRPPDDDEIPFAPEWR